MKIKELKNMTVGERERKLEELKVELIRSRANASKTGSSKTKQIKKIIARLLTLERLDSKRQKSNSNK